jgi:hypothetical protein
MRGGQARDARVRPERVACRLAAPWFRSRSGWSRNRVAVRLQQEHDHVQLAICRHRQGNCWCCFSILAFTIFKSFYFCFYSHNRCLRAPRKSTDSPSKLPDCRFRVVNRPANDAVNVRDKGRSIGASWFFWAFIDQIRYLNLLLGTSGLFRRRSCGKLLGYDDEGRTTVMA